MTNPLLQSVQLALQNATQKEALLYIDKLVSFCIEKENGKVLSEWPKELIQLLVAYHIAKNTIIVEAEGDKIIGLGMWYNCNEDAGLSFIDNWEPDTDGDAIFIGFLNAIDTKTFKRITERFIEVCPDALHKKIIMLRRKRGIATRIETNHKLFNKILAI